ncbi:MAG TPA: RNA methyltransferase [Saprospiraceae bacterium]|nr:RNA methyltransferase [Saprospiraceae bacterium]
MISKERSELFKKVIARRQHDLTIILENVHDPHNIGAVLRTCDSVGVGEIFVIITDQRIEKIRYKEVASSSGAGKWVVIHLFDSVQDCIREVRKKFPTILATHLCNDSVSLYDLELTMPVALAFGNESEGLSNELVKNSDLNFKIPQMGFVHSLNISVACAVSLYEAFRQREIKGFYKTAFQESNPLHHLLYNHWVKIHRNLPG